MQVFIAFIDFALQLIIITSELEYMTYLLWASFSLTVAVFICLITSFILGIRRPKTIIKKEIIKKEIIYLPIESDFETSPPR